MRLVSRVSQEYAGACPFCGGDPHHSDRFHVWLTPTGRERYWCRRCNRKGSVTELRNRQQPRTPPTSISEQYPTQPNPRHVPYYRELYEVVTVWAQRNLYQAHNPEPLTYLHSRGFDDSTIRWARLGYALHDPQALLVYLKQQAPTLIRYAVEAGILTRNRDRVRVTDPEWRTHHSLCGRIVIPYLSQQTVYDLRARRFPGSGYASLPGSYAQRGATIPYCWDTASKSDVVIITEGEFKALAVTAAYRSHCFPYPALSHPGLNYARNDWATQLVQRGVRVAILAYDTRAMRPVDDCGQEQLAPEEAWTIRHGRTLTAAGLHVLVFTLPINRSDRKQDLDGFLLRYGPGALSTLLNTTAKDLKYYMTQLPRQLLQHAGLA